MPNIIGKQVPCRNCVLASGPLSCTLKHSQAIAQSRTTILYGVPEASDGKDEGEGDLKDRRAERQADLEALRYKLGELERELLAKQGQHKS